MSEEKRGLGVSTEGGDAALGRAARLRDTLVFGAVALAWLALDTLTKGYLNGSFAVGEVAGGPFLGLVRFRLVHNTGAAWGMFGDSTFLLGVVSIAVCLVLVAYLFFLSPRPGMLEVVGVALVVAGGLGNAFDRFLRLQNYLSVKQFPLRNSGPGGEATFFICRGTALQPLQRGAKLVHPELCICQLPVALCGKALPAWI